MLSRAPCVHLSVSPRVAPSEVAVSRRADCSSAFLAQRFHFCFSFFSIFSFQNHFPLPLFLVPYSYLFLSTHQYWFVSVFECNLCIISYRISRCRLVERAAIGHNFCTVAPSLQTTSEDFLVLTRVSGHSYLTVVLVLRTHDTTLCSRGPSSNLVT